MRLRVSFLVCLVCLGVTGAVAPTPAAAQMNPGVQAGMLLDPDQFFFGGHIETAPLIDRLRFRPGVDIGLGDDTTLVAGNFDFTYTFPNGRSGWNLFAGGGPSINWYDYDDGGSNTDGGFNFLVGARQNSGLSFEFRVGMAGSPDLKFGVGYTFR
jgi:hypothetical protein